MYRPNLQLRLLWLLIPILLSQSLVEAGHGLWEPKPRANSETRSSGLHKRWFTIDASPTTNQLWPKGGEISYYYENSNAEKKLKNGLADGYRIWIQGGLPEATFKITQVDKKAYESNKKSVLLIRYNGDGILKASPGVPVTDDDSGPTMDLSDRTDAGMLDVAANIAHELGHVWGLLHEHQIPAFWEVSDQYDLTSNFFHFNCNNLRDWDEIVQKAPNADDQKIACASLNRADALKVSSAEFVPRKKSGRAPQGDNLEPDWHSIMMYPSTAGGRLLGGQRLPVLTRANGDPITPNLVPSQGDIDALIRLYDNDDPDKEAAELLVAASSSKFSDFKKIFKKNKKGDC